MTATANRDDNLILLSDCSTGTTVKIIGRFNYKRASSVHQNNKKLYGPANALDYNNVTSSWYSEGNPKGKSASFFVIDFSRSVNPAELVVQFQAGFSAEEITVYRNSSKITDNDTTSDLSPRWVKVEEIEADDDHEAQAFPLSMEEPTNALKIVFDETTDFYGRLIVYQIQTWGLEVI